MPPTRRCVITGSVVVQLYKDLGHQAMSRLLFFEGFSLILAAAGIVLLSVCGLHILRRARAAV